MKRDKCRARAGFTLIEIVAVLAITAIFAAIAAPSMLDFLNTGRQTNRGNIARTVYLGAQNRLTELKLTKNLKAFFAEDTANPSYTDWYYTKIGEDYVVDADKLKDYNNVYKSLDDYLPAAEITNGNQNYIHYISKTHGAPAANNPVAALLAPVILDATILNGAILIEFNIQTGAVLSVFYSDTLDDGLGFSYTARDNSTQDIYDTPNARPYTKAYERGQGYYGIGDTGKLTEVSGPATINIYDSYTKPLPDTNSKNVLYAEILIPANQIAGNTFNLLINGTVVEGNVSFEGTLTSPMATDLGGALSNARTARTNSESDIVMYRNDTGTPAGYARIIWVLDYVGGDMVGGVNRKFRINDHTQYDLLVNGSSNIRVSIQGSVSATSVTEAHPYFFTEIKKAYGNASPYDFTIKSARHLYNIRNMTDNKFTQRSDIDLSDIDNFEPISSLIGSYNGTGYAIQNLNITSSKTDVGLFGTVNAGAYATGLTLENPNVSGGTNTGSVCGTLEGVVTGAYVRYTDAAKKISGGGNVGGIVGLNNGGILTDSTFISPTAVKHFSDSNPLSTTGGIVGDNSATGRLQRLMFLAIAPINGANINPIVGTNSASTSYLSNLHYLSGTAIYPSISPNDYNPLPANGSMFTGLGTDKLYELQLSDLSSWSVLTGVDPLNPESNIYPYPYPKYSASRIIPDSAHEWPIAGDLSEVLVNSIVYYEKYSNGDYGFWTADGLKMLRDDNSSDSKIEQAGYAIILNEALSGTHYFYARPAGAAGDWDSAPVKVSLSMDNTTDLAEGIAETLGKDAGEIWAFDLPLADLYGAQTRSTPLEVRYTIDIEGLTKVKTGYMQPLFAKGLYSSVSVPDNKFYIRTPWQMKNISKLTAATDYTSGNTFSQERNLDFTNTGVGVHSVDGADGTDLSNAAVTGVFKGTYDGNGKTISNAVINGSSAVGLFSENNGIIKKVTLKDSTVSGTNENVGGIAGRNAGVSAKIEECLLKTVDVSGGTNNIGGVTGNNAATIAGTGMEDSTVSGSSENVGGIAGRNEGDSAKIENCRIKTVTVSGRTGNIGGVTGYNTATIAGTNVENSTVGGGQREIGGIAGRNEGSSAKIKDCLLKTVTISGSNNNIGGIAGYNTASITGSSITGSEGARSTVTGGDSNIGGIAGSNGGDQSKPAKIENCRATYVDISGTHNTGGIAGSSGGGSWDNPTIIAKSSVEYSTVKGTGSSIGGIAGENSGIVEDVFFLSTNTIDNMPITFTNYGGGIVGTTSAVVTRALYLAPAPVSSDKKTIYPIVGNCASGVEAQHSFYLSGHRYSPSNGTAWKNDPYNRGIADVDVAVSGGGTGLITDFFDKDWLSNIFNTNLDKWFQPGSGYPYPMISGMTAPSRWPVTDSPARPDQFTDPTWQDTQPTSDRAISFNFLNGGFDGSYPDTAIVENAKNGNYSNYRHYVNMDAVSGWRTRPVNTADYAGTVIVNGVDTKVLRWRMFELQEPINVSTHPMYDNYMYTDYAGNYHNPPNISSPQFRYAELNADVPGTLYQLCKTNPGAQFYYSFYHTSRLADKTEATVADKMSFYLTGVSDTAENANDSELVLIRPCWSPRSRGTKTTDSNVANRNYNPAATNTVAYGNSHNLSYYEDKFTNFPKDGNPYLYDVWITDAGYNYGITFWSNTPINNIPANGWTAATAGGYTDNIIGYWGVSNGWKHYYGLYTVPKDQNRTEFAFQSNTPLPANYGNYLDGITFKAPSFLSIDKYARMGESEVKFVKPGDTVTMELNVKSWGGIHAKDITVKDALVHTQYIPDTGNIENIDYTEYIEYVKNSAKVTKKDGVTPLPYTTSVTYNSGTVIANLGANTLAADEEVKITFQVKIRDKLASNNSVTTLLYYFKNQAVVEYYENEYKGYADTTEKVKKNFSVPIQVFIDPIKLTKTVKTDMPDAVPDDPLIDGPFVVTLTVGNALEGGNYIETSNALLTDVIPKGFTISGRGNLPSDCIPEPTEDDHTRIIIRNANLDASNKNIPLQYWYTITYDGNGYGVTYTNTSADYKYIYQNSDQGIVNPVNAILKFPQPVVGIKIKTVDDVFAADKGITIAANGSTEPYLVPITENDNFAEKLTAGNYSVVPEIVLFDNNGNIAGKNGNDYQVEFKDSNGNIKGTAYLPSGTNILRFVPTPDSDGEYKLYYKIVLEATQSGATPEKFVLTSNLTTVTVNVSGTSSTASQ